MKPVSPKHSAASEALAAYSIGSKLKALRSSRGRNRAFHCAAFQARKRGDDPHTSDAHEICRVYGVDLQLGQIAKTFEHSPAANPEDFELLRSMIGDLSDGLRGAAHRLHPAIIEDLGLAPALRLLVSDFRAFGLDLTASIYDLPEAIPVETATSLYRIAQEALHSTLRHAPGAPSRLSLRSDGDQIELRIEDAGPDFHRLTWHGNLDWVYPA